MSETRSTSKSSAYQLGLLLGMRKQAGSRGLNRTMKLVKQLLTHRGKGNEAEAVRRLQARLADTARRSEHLTSLSPAALPHWPMIAPSYVPRQLAAQHTRGRIGELAALLSGTQPAGATLQRKLNKLYGTSLDSYWRERRAAMRAAARMG